MSFRNCNRVVLPLVILLCAPHLPVRGQPVVTPPDAGQIKDSQQAYMLLRRLANDSLALEDSTGRKRVWIADGVLHYDIRPEPLTNLAFHTDCFTRPLEILIRSAALLRDLTAVAPNQKFWKQPLETVETRAMSMVQVAYQTTNEERCIRQQQAYAAEVQAEFQNLGKGLDAYARDSHLSTLGTRGLPNGFKVHIRIEPPQARVRFMPFLDYRRCQYFSLPLQEHWNDLTEGNQELIGRYHYRAEWPPSLNGPEEGNFDIRQNGDVTFRPKSN